MLVAAPPEPSTMDIRGLGRQDRYEAVAIRIEKDGRWTLPERPPALLSAGDVIAAKNTGANAGPEAHMVAHPGAETLWRRFAALDSASPKAWMDAYLAACAITSGLRLVSLDRDFKTYEPQGLDLLQLDL